MGLMAQLAKGIVGGQMAWGLLAIGAAFGIALLLCGARSPMLIAVGMYLPFDTSSAIFVGGLMKWLLDRRTAGFDPDRKLRVDERGTLLASGLIAGEAIVGRRVAVPGGVRGYRLGADPDSRAARLTASAFIFRI